MPLFTFDEENFSKGFSAVVVVEEDPVAVEELMVADEDPVVYTGEPGVDSGYSLSVPDANKQSAASHGLRARRRSSVYLRVSVRKASVLASHGIAIPSDFVPEEEALGLEHVRKLADFEPLKVLGQGAYGKVHLVRDRLSGKLYAQKQIRKPQIDVFEDKTEELPHEAMPHLSHIHRTIAERHILTQITHHANIVKLFYALQDHDRFYLLLEYIPGGELFHHLTTNNSLGNVFIEEHVAFYAAQMALGIRHLHQLGIVYRDLKPENCLLNLNGHLVLTDFGLSKAIGVDEDSLGCRSIIGTPEYMAPEIIKGEPYDYAVDWWLLGCVIYDMMTGKPPFTGKTHQVILDKIIRSKPSFPFYLSLDAKDILSKLLQKNPAKRFAVDGKWKAFQDHRFFRKIDWKAVESQLAEPPILPIITDPALAENFSPEFTDLKISEYDLASEQTTSAEEGLFLGFSYTASHSFIDRFASRGA